MTDIIGGDLIGSYDDTWKNHVILIIRNIIGDSDPDAYQYSDNRIFQVFLVAATLVILETSYIFNYTINPSEEVVDPNPSADTNFLSLSALKASCIILSSELRSTTKGGRITVKDGPSEITKDMTDASASLKSLSGSVCSQYQETLFAFRAGQNVGIAVMGPYSPGSYQIGRSESGEKRNFN